MALNWLSDIRLDREELERTAGRLSQLAKNQPDRAREYDAAACALWLLNDRRFKDYEEFVAVFVATMYGQGAKADDRIG